MSDTKSLQDLVNSVNTLRQKVDIVGLCSAALMDSNRNSSKLSEFHTRFDSLALKYCEFAEDYRSELDAFHKALLNNIHLNQLRELQKQNERERLEIMKQIEVISNSNTQSDVNDVIVPTPTPSDSSIKYDAKQDDVDTDAKSESVRQTPPTIKKATVTNTRKVQPNAARKSAKPRHTPRKSAPSHQVHQKPKTERRKQENVDTKMAKPYAYNAKKVRWRFRGPQKSSTVVFIGNLPSNSKDNGVQITEKKLQFWIMQKAHVTISQIEEIKLQRGARGMFALARFSASVSLHKIQKLMDKVNGENNDAFVNNKDKSRLSWKKQVFLRLNRNFSKSGDAMWNDKQAQHRLFIRNFDILDSNCHYELTHAVLEYGDLYEDIEIRVDGFGDPYCIVTFKYLNDAIYCRNAHIAFHGRELEMRYAKY
eukprot:409822_1